MEKKKTSSLNNNNEGSQIQNKDAKKNKSYSVSHTNAIYNRLRGKRLINMRIQNRIELMQNHSKDKVIAENSTLHKAGDETEIVLKHDDGKFEKIVQNTEEKVLSSENISTKDYFEIPGKDLKGTKYTRIVIIGDCFLSSYHKFWPIDSNIQPYFLFKNKLSIDEVYFKFQDHPYLKNSKRIIVLFVLGLHDFAQYGTHVHKPCSGRHKNIQYIEDLKSIKGYAKKLLEVKEKYLGNENLSVLFSYFPSLHNVRLLKEIFNYSKDESLDCGCSVNDLDCVAENFIKSDFFAITQIYQRYMTTVQINVIRDCGVFEYIPPTISFMNGEWKLATDGQAEKNIAVLNHILNEFVFDIDENKVANIRTQLSTMRNLIVKKNFRIALIGDKWIASVAYQWPGSHLVNPFFYFQDNFMFRDLRKAILTLVKGDEYATVIVTVPAGEFFTMRSSAKCEGHKSLEYPVPNDRILKNPINFAHQLIEKMNVLMQEIKQMRKNCVIVFINCYPVRMASYYEYLTEAHSQTVSESAHINSLPIDVNFSEFDTKLSQCFDMINQYIQTANEVQNYPLCNIAQVVNSSNDKFIFPTYIEDICPSTNLSRELFNLLKLYIGIFNRTSLNNIVSVTLADQYVRKLKMAEMKKSNKRASEIEDLKKNKREKLDSSSGKESSKSSRSRKVSSEGHNHGSSSKKLRMESKDPVSKSCTSSGDRPSADALRSLAMLGDRKLVIAELKESSKAISSSQAIKQTGDEDSKPSSKDRPSSDILRSLAVLGDRKLALATAKEDKLSATSIKRKNPNSTELCNIENSHSVLKNTRAISRIDQDANKVQNLDKVSCDTPKEESGNKTKHPPKDRPSGDILKFLAALGDRKLATAKAKEVDSATNSSQGITNSNGDSHEKSKNETNCLVNQKAVDTSKDSDAVTSDNKKATVITLGVQKDSPVASCNKKISAVASADEKTSTVASYDKKARTAVSTDEKDSVVASGDQTSCNNDDNSLQGHSLDAQKSTGLSGGHEMIQIKNLKVSPTKKISSSGRACSKNLQLASDDHHLTSGVDQRTDKLKDSGEKYDNQEKESNHKSRNTPKDHAAHQLTMKHIENSDQIINISQNISSSTKTAEEFSDGNPAAALDSVKISVVDGQEGGSKLLPTSSVAYACQKLSNDKKEVPSKIHLPSTGSLPLEDSQISKVHIKESNTPTYSTLSSSQRSDEALNECQQLMCENSVSADSSNTVQHIDEKSEKKSRDETLDDSLKDISPENNLKPITTPNELQTVDEDPKKSAGTLQSNQNKASVSSRQSSSSELKGSSESAHQVNKSRANRSDSTSLANQKKRETDKDKVIDRRSSVLHDHNDSAASLLKDHSDDDAHNASKDRPSVDAIRALAFLGDRRAVMGLGKDACLQFALKRKKESENSSGHCSSTGEDLRSHDTLGDHKIQDDIIKEVVTASNDSSIIRDKSGERTHHSLAHAEDSSANEHNLNDKLSDSNGLSINTQESLNKRQEKKRQKKENGNGSSLLHSDHGRLDNFPEPISRVGGNQARHRDDAVLDATLQDYSRNQTVPNKNRKARRRKKKKRGFANMPASQDRLGSNNFPRPFETTDDYQGAQCRQLNVESECRANESERVSNSGFQQAGTNDYPCGDLYRCPDKDQQRIIPSEDSDMMPHTFQRRNVFASTEAGYLSSNRSLMDSRTSVDAINSSQMINAHLRSSNQMENQSFNNARITGARPQNQLGRNQMLNNHQTDVQLKGKYVNVQIGDDRQIPRVHHNDHQIDNARQSQNDQSFDRARGIHQMANAQYSDLEMSTWPQNSQTCVQVRGNRQMVNLPDHGGRQITGTQLQDHPARENFQMSNMQSYDRRMINMHLHSDLSDVQKRNNPEVDNVQAYSDRQMTNVQLFRDQQASVRARSDRQMVDQAYSDHQIARPQLFSGQLTSAPAQGDRQLYSGQDYSDNQMATMQQFSDQLINVQARGDRQMTNVHGYHDRRVASEQSFSGQFANVQSHGNHQMDNIQGYRDRPLNNVQLESDQPARFDRRTSNVQGFCDRQISGAQTQSSHFPSIQTQDSREMTAVNVHECYQRTQSQVQYANATSDGYQGYNEAVPSSSNSCPAVKNLASKVYRLMTSSNIKSPDNVPVFSPKSREFYNELPNAPANNSAGVAGHASKLYNISDSKFKEPNAPCAMPYTVLADNETFHPALSGDQPLSSARSHVLLDDQLINAKVQSETHGKFVENKDTGFETSQSLPPESGDIHESATVGVRTHEGQLNDYSVMSDNIHINKSSDTEYRKRTTKRSKDSPSISSTDDNHRSVAAAGSNEMLSVNVKNSDTNVQENCKNREAGNKPTQAPPRDRPSDSILRSFASIGDLNAKNVRDPAAITWVLR